MTDSPHPIHDAASTGGEVNRPQVRRPSLSSPWVSVVRGDPEKNSLLDDSATGDSVFLSPPPEQSSGSGSSLIEGLGSDGNSNNNGGRPGRSAWNRPVNDAPEPVSVMGGAVSWPALSETTRSVPRSSPDAPSPFSDGREIPSQAPTASQSSQRSANNSATAISSSNNTKPTRLRLRNRGGGGSSVSSSLQNDFTSQPLLMVPSPVLEVPHNMVPPMLDTCIRGSRPAGGVGGSQSHAVTYHPQRNKSRWGAYGHHAGGDGAHLKNHGGRPEQYRQDVHHTLQFVPAPAHPGGFISPPPLPPGAGPFMPHPPPFRVFPGQMSFASPYIYFSTMPPDTYRRPVQMVPTQPLYYPANDTLTSMIIIQVDFYFSDDNLAKDNFLRSKMDGHGWVPITLIASFRRVQQLTKDIPAILESLKNSAFVEVQGDKVRRRNEWKKWLPSSSWIDTDSVSKTSTAPDNELAASLQEVSLNYSSTSPDEFTRQVGLADAEDTVEGTRTISV